eukprot:gene13946-biopygen11110
MRCGTPIGRIQACDALMLYPPPPPPSRDWRAAAPILSQPPGACAAPRPPGVEGPSPTAVQGLACARGRWAPRVCACVWVGGGAHYDAVRSLCPPLTHRPKMCIWRWRAGWGRRRVAGALGAGRPGARFPGSPNGRWVLLFVGGATVGRERKRARTGRRPHISL